MLNYLNLLSPGFSSIYSCCLDAVTGIRLNGLPAGEIGTYVCHGPFAPWRQNLSPVHNVNYNRQSLFAHRLQSIPG